MIPKLTDDAVSRLPLAAGRAELLEEIMSTVADRHDPDTLDHPTPLHSRRTRWVAPLAAAAVVAGLAGGTLWWQDHRAAPQHSSSVAAQLGLQEGQSVVLAAPGWKVDSMGDGLRYRNGGAQLEITSYDADQYDSYVKDREYITETRTAGQPIQVLGRPALMWAYSATDHTAIREVQNGRWMEFRAEGVDQAGYLALLGDLRVVSTADFEASLPDDFVTRGERIQAGQQILDDIAAVSGAGLPDGVDVSFADGDAEDRYQFGAEVVGAYACSWLEALDNAQAHDQAEQVAAAERVLGTSHDWPILKEMDKTGDYPEVLWQIADDAHAGTVPDWYREGLGC